MGKELDKAREEFYDAMNAPGTKEEKLSMTKKAIEARQAEKAARKQELYDKGYQRGLKSYGRQATEATFPKADKFIRENIYDPVMDKMLSGGNDYDKGERKARKDVLGYKKGGMIKSSASRRADGCAVKGKTKGRMV